MAFWDWAFEPYLAGTPGDSDGETARAFLDEMEAMLEARSVAKSVPVALRLVEVLSATLTARALEQAVYAKGVVQEAESDPKLHPFLEAMAKAMERRRKALTELEENCALAGQPTEIGIADSLRPLLKRADGVLEEAIAYERKKEARRAAKLAKASSGGGAV